MTTIYDDFGAGPVPGTRWHTLRDRSVLFYDPDADTEGPHRGVSVHRGKHSHGGSVARVEVLQEGREGGLISDYSAPRNPTFKQALAYVTSRLPPRAPWETQTHAMHILVGPRRVHGRDIKDATLASITRYGRGGYAVRIHDSLIPGGSGRGATDMPLLYEEPTLRAARARVASVFRAGVGDAFGSSWSYFYHRGHVLPAGAVEARVARMPNGPGWSVLLVPTEERPHPRYGLGRFLSPEGHLTRTPFPFASHEEARAAAERELHAKAPLGTNVGSAGMADTQPVPVLSARPPWVVVRDGRDGVRVVARARSEAAARDAAMAALLRDRDGRVEYHVHHVHHAPWTDTLGAQQIPGDATIDSDLPVVLIDRDGVPGEILQPEDPKHAKALDRAVRGGYDGQALLYLHGSGGDRRVNVWKTGKGLSAVAQVVGGFGDAFPGTDDALHDQIVEYTSAWAEETQAVAAGKVSAADAAKAIPDAEDALSALGDAVRALQGAAGQLGTVAPGTAEGQRHRHRRLVQSLRSLAGAFFRGAKDSEGKAIRWEDVLPEVPTTPRGGTEVLGHADRPMGRLCDPASILGVPPPPPKPAGSHTAVEAGEAGTILLSTASVLTATMASELSEGIADAANEVREWAFTWETRRRGIPQLPSEGIMQQLRSHDLVPGGGVLGEAFGGIETDIGEDGCEVGGWACEDGTGASSESSASASTPDLPRIPSETAAVYLLRDRRAFLLSGPGDPDHEPNIAVFTSRGTYAGPKKIGDRFYDVWTVRLPGGEPYDVGQIAPGAPAAVRTSEIGAVNRLATLRDRLRFRRVPVSWDGTKGYELRGLRSGYRVVVVPRTGRGFVIEAYEPTGAALILGAHLHEAEARHQALAHAREHGWFRSAFGSSEDDGPETDIGEDVEIGAPPAEPAHSAWAPDRTQPGWPYGDNTFPASGTPAPTAAPTEAYVPMPPPSKYAPPPPVAPGQSPHTPWVPIGKKASAGWPGLPNKPQARVEPSTPAAYECPRSPGGSYAPGGDAARTPGWGSGTHSNTGFGRRRKP